MTVNVSLPLFDGWEAGILLFRPQFRLTDTILFWNHRFGRPNGISCGALFHKLVRFGGRGVG